MSSGRHATLPDLMRGVAGGALLGVPLLYTQEMWRLGATLNPFAIAAMLAATFGLGAVLSSVVGFQAGPSPHPVQDAVIGTGMSIVLAFVLLILLGRLRLGMPAAALVGVVTLSAVPIAIGFAAGSALAPASGGEGADRMVGGAGDLLAAAAGAVLLALNIAPTEEPILLAGELGWIRLLLLLGASLLLPYLIVFYAEFGGREERRASDGATQGPLTETLLAYLVAFGLSVAMLAAFGRTEALDGVALSEAVVLAFPASLGAALGRMLV